MNTQQMGLFIRALRSERGLTQKELAAQLQITDKAVSKWERSLSFPDITLLPALAGALGVTVSELLNGAREAPPPDEQAREGCERRTGQALRYAAGSGGRDLRPL